MSKQISVTSLKQYGYDFVKSSVKDRHIIPAYQKNYASQATN